MLAVLDWSDDLAVESGDTERCESGRIGRSRKPLTGNGPWVRIPPSPPLPRQEQTPLKEGEHGIAPYRENRSRLDSEPTRQKRSTSRPARASHAATQAPAPLLCHSHKTSRLSFPMFPSAIPNANPHTCHSRRFRLSFPTFLIGNPERKSSASYSRPRLLTPLPGDGCPIKTVGHDSLLQTPIEAPLPGMDAR